MVTNTGAADGAGALQAVNKPVAIKVQANEAGMPMAIRVGHRWHAVVEYEDRWRIDDEWWRERPVHRDYYDLLLEDGVTLTVFRDCLTQSWYRQRYG